MQYFAMFLTPHPVYFASNKDAPLCLLLEEYSQDTKAILPAPSEPEGLRVSIYQDKPLLMKMNHEIPVRLPQGRGNCGDPLGVRLSWEFP